MKIDLSGKTALVTGASRGLGAAIVKQLIDSGAQVIGTATRVPHDRKECEFVAVNFENASETEQFARAMSDRKIDILINNAGINKIDLAGEVDMADWDRIQAVNLRAPMVLVKALAPEMAKRSFGRIVNIGSIFGHVSKSKRISYSTSKFGLIGITKALALDYATSNVLVNAVAPGFLDTELTRTVLSPQQIEELVSQVPLRRLGQVDEVARLVCFLSSPQNSFLTAQNIVIDGGFTSA